MEKHACSQALLRRICFEHVSDHTGTHRVNEVIGSIIVSVILEYDSPQQIFSVGLYKKSSLEMVASR